MTLFLIIYFILFYSIILFRYQWCDIEHIQLPTVAPPSLLKSSSSSDETVVDSATSTTSAMTLSNETTTETQIDDSIVLDKPDHGPPGVILLDLCCGTGTIGLMMASSVKLVVGVDIVKEAIKDAEANAELSGVKNAIYIADKVEEAIRGVMKRHVRPGDVVVAVLDPPRSGVGAAVISSVRGCEGIERVVYVSCDFSQVLNNFSE